MATLKQWDALSQKWIYISSGSNGKSAYEIAVDNGFVGDEVAWLSWIKEKNIDMGNAFSIDQFDPLTDADIDGGTAFDL